MSENEKAKVAEIAEKFQRLEYGEQRYVEGYMQGVQSAQERRKSINAENSAPEERR